MLDNDPRYLRPESRLEMDQRISSLSVSPSRRRRTKKRQSPPPPPYDEALADVKEEFVSDTDNAEESDSIDQIKDGILQGPELFAPEFGRMHGNPAFSTGYSGYPSAPNSISPASVTAGSSHQKMAFKLPRRQSTVLSGSTELSSSSIQDLKKRVSGCSTRYAKQISTLLKHFTISSASDLTQRPPLSERRPSVCSTDAGPPELEVFEAFPEVGYALPGDFINTQNLNCAGFPGEDHYSGKCWCSIAALVSNEKTSWLLPTGELSTRAQRVLADPSQMNLASRDCFGNTPLHLFAALEGYQEALFGMVLHTADVCATNNSGQTFLHLLNIEWFSDLNHISAPLKQLLAYLRDYAPDLVYIKDVYGRTFFSSCSFVAQGL